MKLVSFKLPIIPKLFFGYISVKYCNNKNYEKISHTILKCFIFSIRCLIFFIYFVITQTNCVSVFVYFFYYLYHNFFFYNYYVCVRIVFYKCMCINYLFIYIYKEKYYFVKSYIVYIISY